MHPSRRLGSTRQLTASVLAIVLAPLAYWFFSRVGVGELVIWHVLPVRVEVFCGAVLAIGALGLVFGVLARVRGAPM